MIRALFRALPIWIRVPKLGRIRRAALPRREALGMRRSDHRIDDVLADVQRQWEAPYCRFCCRTIKDNQQLIVWSPTRVEHKACSMMRMEFEGSAR